MVQPGSKKSLIPQPRNATHSRARRYGDTASFVLTLALLFGVSTGCMRQQAPKKKEISRSALDAYYEGERHLRSGNLAGAREAFERSLEVAPRPQVHWRLAQLLAEAGEFDAARAELENAIQESPSFSAAHRELVRLDAKISIQESAPRQEGPADSEPQPVAFVMTGGIVSDPGAALPDQPLPATAAPIPTPTPIPTNLSPEQIAELEKIVKEAEFLDFSDAKEQAIARYREGLAIDKERGELYYRIGNIYLESGRPQHAVVEFLEAVERTPTLSKAHNNLGVAYEQLRELERAIESYGKAIEIDNYLDAHYNLGKLYEKTGRWEEAIEAYRAYVELDPTSEWGAKARARLQTLERALY